MNYKAIDSQICTVVIHCHSSAIHSDTVAANNSTNSNDSNGATLELREGPNGPDAPGYPAAFVSYLARLLLARDERCAKWWQSALSAS